MDGQYRILLLDSTLERKGRADERRLKVGDTDGTNKLHGEIELVVEELHDVHHTLFAAVGEAPENRPANKDGAGAEGHSLKKIISEHSN
jgi:hypothetical protein